MSQIIFECPNCHNVSRLRFSTELNGNIRIQFACSYCKSEGDGVVEIKPSSQPEG